ncbi:hypothetical protein KM043_010633 [Ampulex compressa]|nr:hypothetical protein KM043_010633 [Ampulex compressa]
MRDSARERWKERDGARVQGAKGGEKGIEKKKGGRKKRWGRGERSVARRGEGEERDGKKGKLVEKEEDEGGRGREGGGNAESRLPRWNCLAASTAFPVFYIPAICVIVQFAPFPALPHNPLPGYVHRHAWPGSLAASRQLQVAAKLRLSFPNKPNTGRRGARSQRSRVDKNSSRGRVLAVLVVGVGANSNANEDETTSRGLEKAGLTWGSI